jgi:hypothetical protein
VRSHASASTCVLVIALFTSPPLSFLHLQCTTTFGALSFTQRDTAITLLSFTTMLASVQATVSHQHLVIYNVAPPCTPLYASPVYASRSVAVCACSKRECSQATQTSLIKHQTPRDTFLEFARVETLDIARVLSLGHLPEYRADVRAAS